MKCNLIHGDAVELLRSLEPDSIDATIADAPYSSGGFTRSDRNQKPSQKYQSSDTTRSYGEFAGDNRDSRSYAYWSHLWMSAAYRATKPSGYLLTFSDWRQLPTTTDALQAAGWVWRGITVWDKGLAARAPHTGYFRHQAEYIVWGTKGVSKAATHGGPLPGCFQVPVLQRDKFHITGKPTALMKQLVRIVPPAGTVCDPFAGSATTAVACLQEQRQFVGFEADAHWFNVGTARIAEAMKAAA